MTGCYLPHDLGPRAAKTADPPLDSSANTLFCSRVIHTCGSLCGTAANVLILRRFSCSGLTPEFEIRGSYTVPLIVLLNATSVNGYDELRVSNFVD